MIKIFKYKYFPAIVFVLILILIAIVVFLPKPKLPNITNTTPSDGTDNVIETSQININFASVPNDAVKKGVSVSIDPQTDFDSTWLTSTYKVVPKSSLKNNQRYTVKVLYNKETVYAFTFTTEVYSQADATKYGTIQSKMDYDYGQAVKDTAIKYPFYTSLPIKTQNYIIDYDFSKSKFVITFTTNLTLDQQNTLIQDAIKNIKSVGGTDPVQYYTVTVAPSPIPSPAP